MINNKSFDRYQVIFRNFHHLFLSLRKTAVDIGKTVLKNNTATTKSFTGKKVTLLTTPAKSSSNTTIETQVSDKALAIALPDKSGLFSSSASSTGYIIAAYSVAADIYQTEKTASSIISPAVEIELSDHSKDTSNLTDPLVIFFEVIIQFRIKISIGA